MNYLGIFTVLLAAIALIYSRRCFNKDQIVLSLLLMVLSSLLLKVFAASDPFLHEWDERYHALAAKNMMGHLLKPTLFDTPVLPYDIKDWTNNHIWLHKQPLTLWLIALSLKVFGITAFAVRIPSIILSSIGIVFMYDIASRLYQKTTGFYAAFFFAIHGLIIELTAGRVNTDHPDVIFLFFLLLAVWITTIITARNWLWMALLAGFSMGCAILTKWLPALVVLPVAMFIIFNTLQDKRKTFLCLMIMVIVAAIMAIPWQLYILRTFPTEAAWEYHFNTLHITTALEGHKRNWFYHFDQLRMQYGELVYLPVIMFSINTIKNKQLPDLALSAWFWIVFVFFSFVATKSMAYTIMAAPAVFIMNALAIEYFIKKSPPKSRWRAFHLLIAICLVVLPIRYTIERVKPFEVPEKSIALRERLSGIKARIKHPHNTIVFNDPHYIETMFYLNCIAYRDIPEPKVLDSLRQHYSVVVLQ